MPMWRRSAGVWRKVKPHLRNAVSFTDAPVIKGFVRRSGTWDEFYPTIPDTPVPTVTPVYRNDIIEIDAAWNNPGGTAQSLFQVRLLFTHRTDGRTSATAWVGRTASQFTWTFDNSGFGWATFSDDWNVQAQVIAYSGSDTVGYFASGTGTSPAKRVINYPAPAAPTSFDVNIPQYFYQATWAYTDTNKLTNFQIQTWLDNRAATTYTVPAANRSWVTEPWDPATVGTRHTVTTRIRAVGPGGVSAWVTVTGVMPGPVTVTDVRFRNGGLEFHVADNDDGVHYWTQRYEGSLEWDHGRVTSNNVYFESPVGNSFPRDGELRYRIRLQAETATGWTGRYQYTTWVIKMPNPAYFKPTNTLTLTNNSTWRTSADGRHIYQGLDNSGDHNAAVAWYGTAFNDFYPDRIGYTLTATQIHVAMRRYALGGAGGGTRVRWYVHNQRSYSGGIPTFADDEFGKYLVWNESAWVPAPTKYWGYWIRGTWHGITARSTLAEEYMILWRHDVISAGSLDGWPFWTIKVVHDG